MPATLTASAPAARLGRRDIGWVVLFCLLWSSAFAAAKIALADCPPLILLAVRFLLAGGLMLVLAAAGGLLTGLRRQDVAALAFLGLLNNAFYLGFTWVGLASVSSAFTTIIISLNPILVAVGASLMLGERLTPVKAAGLALGLAGVAIVLRSRLSGGIESLHGTVLVGLGLAALCGGTLLFKRLRPAGGLWAAAGIQFLSAGIAVIPVALATESLADVHVTPRLLGALAFIVVASSMGAYSLWFWLLSRMTATAASSLHFLMPPLGLLFGWLALGEPVAAADLVGIVPIALGIRLVTREPAAAG